MEDTSIPKIETLFELYFVHQFSYMKFYDIKILFRGLNEMQASVRVYNSTK